MLVERHDTRRRPLLGGSWFCFLSIALAIAFASVKAHPDATTEAADLLEEYTRLSNSSLRWVQRPNLYFGMRARVQGDSPMFGIAWYGVQDYNGYQKMRHSCEQEDKLSSYNWVMHDGRSAGIQQINDAENNVKLSVELLKTAGGLEGGNWAARISGAPINASRPSRIALVTYYGLEGLGTLQFDPEEELNEGIDGPIELSGSVASLGAFSIRQVETSQSQLNRRGRHADEYGDLIDRTSIAGLAVPPGNAWRAKDVVLQDIVKAAQDKIKVHGQDSPPDPAILFSLPNEVRTGANFYAFQKTYEHAFSVDVFYETKAIPAAKGMDSTALSSGIAASAEAYNVRFEETFRLAAKGYSESEVDFAKALTASMLGGIGYFYGPSIIDRNFRHPYDEEDDDDEEGSGSRREPKPELTEPHELYTSTPSRSFFPRGFYWDEGFHLMLVGAWDNDLSLEILKSWVNLIDEDGWVGREQILGEEARSKVPEQFRTQYPAYGNPPTLPMGITTFIRRLKSRPESAKTPDNPFGPDNVLGSPSELLASLSSTASPQALSQILLSSPVLARSYLNQLYPKLKRHYHWFRETQKGQLREWGRRPSGSRTEAYRWRGRSEDHVLTSGLDDYPRPKPHEGELHVDLMSWMAFFTRTMKEIAEYIGEADDVKEYDKIVKAILTNLDDLHWSEDEQMYCDLGVDEEEESIHVCNQGYISIFPFLLGLLEPDSPNLGAILTAVSDPAQLWTDFGLRSLSRNHPLYGSGEDYWRSPIWIPLNYLALQSLYTRYAKEPGPYQQQAAKIYNELRSNVVQNVYKEFVRTGYAWEQYDAATGEGKRSHPFTGWTSLVTLMMAEQY